MDSDIFLQSQSYSANEQKKDKFGEQSSQKYNHNKMANGSQILPGQCSTVVESYLTKSKKSFNKESSDNMKSLSAGKKARQRKKFYVEGLQNRVKQTQSDIDKYDEEIKKTKETLNAVLNSSKNNEQSLTYSQLQLCVNSQDPNQDKINLLLDMMKFRIGASGRQRQAKISYCFKQVINLMFPALHRYLLFCSQKNIDLFEQHNIDQFFENHQQSQQNCLQWTNNIIETLQLSDFQKHELLKIKSKFQNKKSAVRKMIQGLNQLKQCIQQQGQVFENVIDMIRRAMRPTQCAEFVIFIQKYKYKREISFQSQSQLFSQTQGSCSKKIKKQ